MSWIFTLVFSGILFSSNNGTPAKPAEVAFAATEAAVTVTQDETERFEQTYPLNANGRVCVSNINGSIVAEAWDRNEVKLIAIKTADSKERLADVEISIDAKQDSFSVETKYDNWKQKGNGERWRNGGKLNVDYQLMVPRGAVINEIETVNGSVTVSNFTNITKVSAVNGTVKATNLRGAADLSTVNGEVLADFTGLDAGSKISLGTVNGKVNLTIPSDSNATLKVDSLNGNITNDFNLPVRKGKYLGRDMYGRLGNGDVKIKLDSVNGDLRILRQNDGRNLSPVKDLLPEKQKDDEDWDSDFDFDFTMDKEDKKDKQAKRDSARIDREVSRAVKESTKATAEVARNIPQMIEALQPMIAKATADSARVAAEAVQSEAVKARIADDFKRQSDAALANLKDANFFRTPPRIEKKSQAFPMKGTPKVTVVAHGCAVKVTGWDKNEVQYAVSQFSDARDRNPISINEKHSDSSLTLTVDNKDTGFWGTSVRARIEVFVPRKTDLVIKTDGEIRLDGISGDIQLEGRDESINVRDVDGKMKVTNADGRIRVIGFRGDLVGETVDGSMSLEGEFQSLSAIGDGGNITVTLSDKADAKIFATSPEVSIDGLPMQVVRNNVDDYEYKIGGGKATMRVSTTGEVLFRNVNSLTAEK